MKKNISINISGIIFHIEEDGYETLKKYLDSINKYFSSFEDSSEILADIESRIAEIFLSKLNEEKQVITLEDVSALIATMGSVSDFKAVEEENVSADSTRAEAGTSQEQSSADQGGTNQTFTPSKQLMRDQKRKILGGVCAGLGNYFNTDPLWIRLIFAVLTFVYGITFFVYIIMWLIVPGSWDLDEPIVTKKMYRDRERKVLGGVAGGVAAYMGIDIVAVRVLFILFTFLGGLGLFVYIVLWMILPEAVSLTDKMQMQGEPVTLHNIESNIKKNLNEKPGEEESMLTRVLLFPFRLIGMILTGLAKILGPLVEVLRVVVGLFILVDGAIIVFSIVVAAGILFGIVSSSALSLPWMPGLDETRVPVDVFSRAFPAWTAIAAFFVAIIPGIFIIMLGASVIAKRLVFNAATGWTLFVLFFVSAAMLAVSIPKIVYSFKEEAGYTVDNSYRINGRTAVLKINEVGMDDYDEVHFYLEGYRGNDFRIVQEFEAQGSTRKNAIENARMVEYHYTFQDSVFTFDSNLTFKDEAVFRAQRMDMTLYIPYNQPFTMDEGISRMVSNYVKSDYRENQTWQFTEEEGLKCLSCPQEKNDDVTDLRDFEEIELNGNFDVHIIQGDSYSVQLKGSDKAREFYDVERRGETLVIDFDGKRDYNWNIKNLDIEEVEITITMPDVEKIEATGWGNIRLDDFHGDDLAIDIRGPVKFRGDVSTHNLNINLSATAEADLSGHTANMTANIEHASKLRAYNLEASNAFVETSSASSAKVNVRDNLEMEEGVASEIDYRGNPNVTKRD